MLEVNVFWVYKWSSRSRGGVFFLVGCDLVNVKVECICKNVFDEFFFELCMTL